MKKGMRDEEKLATVLKDIKFAMLTTAGPDGTLHSRPMATQEIDAKKFDGTLWFFSRKNTLKIFEINQDQRVNLAYAKPEKQSYVSVCGRAFTTLDKTKMQELWTPFLKAWFPEGLEDPQMILIGVRVETAEIWDSPPSKMVQLAGFLKATVTGKPFDQSQNTRHLELRH